MKNRKRFLKLFSGSIMNLFVVFSVILSLIPTTLASANTPDPTSVTIAGSLDTGLGCAGDWDPACATAHLVYDVNDDVWQQSWTVPAGSYEYKAALNNGWTESYGLHAVLGGANIPLTLASPTQVKFYYDHKTHWITDNRSSVIAVAVGSFQNELGCTGDWDPSCLRSWLQDIDGDSLYTFETTIIPTGNYEAKVAINEGWSENYGQGGLPGGANIPFAVSVPASTVTFTYNSTSHVLNITVKAPGPQLDNNVEWDGLRHDSRDTLYRTPGGAVPAGNPVTLRFRTFHNDVNRVQARIYDLNTSAQSIMDMTLVASDVPCYQAGLENDSCDFWAYTLSNTQPENYWYRFIITDGTKTAYYADDTPALDGGLGAPSDDPVDNSYALMVYDPSFSAPSWAKNAVIYQIFPDRFRNGRTNNDPKTGDVRYDDPVIKLTWNTLPEGFCHNNADAATNCPWRFDLTPPASSPTIEQPLGRDYFGGDLKGVDQKLGYLKSLGVNTLYFNPIFDSGSNHGYDTQDYFKIDPYFGTQTDWDNLVKHAKQLGIRIVLDGVYNHMSSDSPFFDRYHHFATVGACESLTSQYRSWFTFHNVAAGTGTCVGTSGANSATYDGWFGFDSIPVLNKSNPAVQAYFITNPNSVTKVWLNNDFGYGNDNNNGNSTSVNQGYTQLQLQEGRKDGVSGWRLDVMGDPSFPDGYWQSFRSAVKSTKSDALIIGELWQKDSTLLRFLRGDLADTTMNYRLRDAVVGLLTSENFDSKGFPDSGHQISPTEFANRLASIREDYPDAAFYSLMNLVDSHDTARILWLLTPGGATTADKELNTANLAIGKRRVEIASLIQFTLPGAPTIYYGDEVGMTGNDDPDNRRTYPWADLGGTPDQVMFSHYQTLAKLRKWNAVLTDGDLRVLFADDTAGTLAYGRKTMSQAALVVINRSDQIQTVMIPVAGYLPDGLVLNRLYGVGNSGFASTKVANGVVKISLNPQSAWLLVTGRTDLQPTAAPATLQVTNEGNAQLSLSWNAVAGATGYNLYRSPVSGGGWVKVNTSVLTTTNFTDTNLRNAQVYYYVVTALDNVDNESAYSNEASGIPHLAIGYAVLQWPKTINQVITANYTTVYGQVYVQFLTDASGDPGAIIAQIGFGMPGSDPSSWNWKPMVFNLPSGNNYEYVGGIRADTVGTYDYLVRFSTDGGRSWVYGDQDGFSSGNPGTNMPGVMTITASSDTTAPTAPVASITFNATSLTVSWTASTDPDDVVAEYRIYRGMSPNGEGASAFAIVSGGTLSYVDTSVNTGQIYYYTVKAFDTSLNASPFSNEVSATAQLRTVTLVFNVTVPATTDATGRNVYIAGMLSRLDGGLPDWNPGAVVLTRVDATHWTITLTGKESTQIEYKYALGDWDHVEKDGGCGEIANRTLTLNYGLTGTMTINDTVINWRNVAPCGN